MGQATITINGRTYRLKCGDGEEERVLALADIVRLRVDSLAGEFAAAGDGRLLLMTALMLADELMDAQARLAHHRTGQKRPGGSATR
jgi:cell division protein ZapA